MPGAARESRDLIASDKHRRKSFRRRIVLTLLTIAAVAVAVVWIGSLAAVVGFAAHDGARKSDAIVVLGAAQYSGKPSPVLRARIDHALGLWRDGIAPMLVFTGGVGSGDTTSEASVSATYARRRGVPDSVMLLETSGRTTSQSIRLVAEMLGTRGENNVVLVSDPFHMFRLWILARRHGLNPRTSPTRSSPLGASESATLGYILSESLKAPVAFLTE